jgi:hypothetical protein
VLDGGLDGAFRAWAESERRAFPPSLDASYTLTDRLLNTVSGLPVAVALLKRIHEDLGPIERVHRKGPAAVVVGSG